jgi:hypothetical protein
MRMKMTVFWDVGLCSLEILTDISEELTASIITLMMEAASSSEKSVRIYQTARCNISEDNQCAQAYSSP